MCRTTILVAVATSCGNVATAAVTYVNVGNQRAGSGSSWAEAKSDLAATVGAAKPGDEVWVAAGTYGPIELRDGVRIIGGFKGNETSAAQSDPDANPTMISGRGVSRAVVGIGNNSSAELRGFIIKDGVIDFPDTGAGVYLENSDAKFVRCVFAHNKARMFGGAVSNWYGSPTFVNCIFRDNDGGYGGGAVFNRKSGSPMFVNCLFHSNTAGEGGAIVSFSGRATFINCTLADNKATVKTAGAVFDNRGDVILRNCILWGNQAVDATTHAIFNSPVLSGASTLTNCNVQDGWAGAGNMDLDPLFVNRAAGDYRLKPDSPCRDAGDAAVLPDDVADLNGDGKTNDTLSKDLAMGERVSGAGVNLGAYE